LATASVLLAVSGCGSGGEKHTTAKAPTPAGGPAPAQLAGNWTMTLRASQLPPNPPPELKDAVGRRSTLHIANSGGIDNGRTLALGASGRDALENSAFGVQGDRILLHREICEAGGSTRFYENAYRWQVSGRRLTFTTVTNRCPDRVAVTLLTANPWTRAAG
jgi:hypothetical protein